MQRGENQMTGLCRCECSRHRLGITHLADQNDVRILPQNGPHGVSEAGGVVANLDLLDDGFAVCMLILNRVFNRNDVISSACVDEVDEGGHRRRFSASGWPSK
jgi:hypothetical protein